jgi:hypothetical protein
VSGWVGHSIVDDNQLVRVAGVIDPSAHADGSDLMAQGCGRERELTEQVPENLLLASQPGSGWLVLQ